MRQLRLLCCFLVVAMVVSVSAPVFSDEFKKASFEIAAVRIHYWEKGQGEPLIIISGLFSSLERMDPARLGILVDELSSDFRVIVMEMRGHGQSSKLYQVTDYGDNMATDIVRLMDHLGLKTANVMGYSYGAMLAGKLVETFPERLQKVILGGASFADINKPADFQWALRYAASIEQGKGLEVLVRDITPPGEEVDRETVAYFDQKYLAPNDTKAMVAVLKGTPKLGINLNILAETTVPILMAAGELDQNSGEALAIQKRFAHINVLVISGEDHLTTVTAPEFVEGVKAFLDEPSVSDNE